MEKVVEYKQHTRLEEKRKKALDQHLSFIVDQTEKYSQLLAEGMNKSTSFNEVAATTVSSGVPSPKSLSGHDGRTMHFCSNLDATLPNWFVLRRV